MASKQEALISDEVGTRLDSLVADSNLPFVLPARYFVLLPSWAVGSRHVPPRSPTRW
jgi:hypothetical protein